MDDFSFDMIKEKLKEDVDFYQKIAGLCILITNGIPENLKVHAIKS